MAKKTMKTKDLNHPEVEMPEPTAEDVAPAILETVPAAKVQVRVLKSFADFSGAGPVNQGDICLMDAAKAESYERLGWVEYVK